MAEAVRVTDIRDPDTAAAYLAEAKESLRHKDTAGMTEALQRLSTSPDCSAMHRFEAAKLFAAAGATVDAIRFYREAGAAYIDPEGDTGRAREAFGEAHALDLQNLDIIFELGRVDMIEGHPRAALAKFTHILNKSHQSYVPALFEAACVHHELGQHDQAVLTLRKVLDRDKSNVQAIVDMGQRLQSMGMVPEAVGYFIQAAIAAQAAGQMGTCRQVINLVVDLDPNNQQARRILAEMDDLPDPAEIRPEELAPQHIRRRDQHPVREATHPVVPAVESANVALAAELDELEARSDRMQRKMSANAGVVAEIEETVASLKSEVNDRMQRKMSAIAGTVTELEESVAGLKAEVAELKSKAPPPIARIEESIAILKAEVAGLTAKSAPAIAKIADIEAKPRRATTKTPDDKPKAPAKKSSIAKPKPTKRVPAKAPTPRR